MGATTTEGVGSGSADKKKKSDRLPLDINKIIGVRPVSAGSCFIGSNGNFEVTMDPLGNVEDFIVMLTSTHKNISYISSPLMSQHVRDEVGNNIGSKWVFEITGEPHTMTYYCVIRT